MFCYSGPSAARSQRCFRVHASLERQRHRLESRRPVRPGVRSWTPPAALIWQPFQPPLPDHQPYPGQAEDICCRQITPARRQCPSHRKARRQHRCTVQGLEAQTEQQQDQRDNSETEDSSGHVAAEGTSSHSSANKIPEYSSAVRPPLKLTSDKVVEAGADRAQEQPPETGVVAEAALHHIDVPAGLRRSTGGHASTPGAYSQHGGVFYPPAESSRIRGSWKHLMRWSKLLSRNNDNGVCVLDETEKIVVFGGGSFGTAMAASLARQKRDLNVSMLIRDPYVCQDINTSHVNSRYLQGYDLPRNVVATTSAQEAIAEAQYAIHAVPVQHSREFLSGIVDLLPRDVPVISVSKGLERGTGQMMSELIAATLGNRQPCAFLSGPSFAKEVMDMRPTGIVAASKDKKLARTMQGLFASPVMRVNTTTDVVGVEICGALKNVLAIAAGIVEGLDLGHNAMAALIAQGCSEIRWLAEKMGAKPETISGLSGLGDIMLTCYGSLSRNRAVGVRLGRGDVLSDIVGSSHQVAEGVSTAGVVVALASRLHVSLPVLTAVAQVLDGALSPDQAVAAIMNLPQIEEK